VNQLVVTTMQLISKNNTTIGEKDHTLDHTLNNEKLSNALHIGSTSMITIGDTSVATLNKASCLTLSVLIICLSGYSSVG